VFRDDEHDEDDDDDEHDMSDWSDEECSESGDFDMSFDLDTNLLSCENDVLKMFFRSLALGVESLVADDLVVIRCSICSLNSNWCTGVALISKLWHFY
jgi:hypothetical protein